MTFAFASLLFANVALSAPPPEVAANPQPPSGPEFRLSLQAEPAFGVGRGSFVTGLGGARFDYRFSPEWSVGPYVGYANLKGPNGGRVHNALLYGLLSYEAPLASQLTLPLRLGMGYLPKNGPYLRTSVGLGYAVSEIWALGLDAVPAFWSVDDRTELSVGLALGVSRVF